MNKEIKVYYRIIFTLLFVVVSHTLSFGQTTIWSEDFSTSSNYTVTLGGEGNDGTSDYFQRTDGSNIGVSYSSNINDFYAAQDIDDGGWSGSASPSELTWTGINISGYSSLSFEGLFASAATAKIDELDYVLIQVNIDNAGWTTILEFENDGTQYNTEFGEDTDFDGDSDGSDLTSTFANFTKSISGTGSSMDLRINISVNSGGEDFAFDEFYIKGTASTPVPEIQAQIPSGTDVACGYTYDFGTQTTGTNTNVVLTIENTGSADLNISSFPLTGSGDYSISPASTSTTISAGSTYDITVTFSPSSTGTLTAKITINSDDSDEGTCEINLTGDGIDACITPTAQPTGLDLTSNTTTTSIDGSFTASSPVSDSYLVVYSTSNSLSANPSDAITYAAGDALGGGTVVGNISGTSFTASSLTSGTEYYFFIFANNNTNCSGGPVYYTTNPLTGNEITVPENISWDNAGCATNSTISLNWTAATGNSNGYLLVVREAAIPHVITGLDPTTNLSESTDYSIAATFGSTVEYSRILYKGTGTSVSITNLPNASCTFKIYTYTIGANGTDYIYSSGTQQTNTISLDNVTSAGANCSDSQSSISWVNPTSSCFDEVMVVANETSGIGFSPSGDGSAYTANTVYSAPDDVVYKGTGTNVTVTNLTNGIDYYFEIFTRKGTEWSSGVEVSCMPNVSTTLYPGDLAIVAVNTNGTTGDEMSFFAFKDITNGTVIQITDNGYERLNAGLWADSEGFINVERTGSTIEAGTVITLIMTAVNGVNSADFDMFICGINDDANWNIYSSGGGSGFNFNSTDQIWMMQDGNWTDPSGSHDATYSGNMLYGWTAIGWETSPGYNSTSGSTLPDGTDCFNTDVNGVTNQDKVKFFSDTSITRSQAAWVGEINSSGNWTGYADNPAYDAGGLDYAGSCVKFKIDNSLGNGAGKWQGGEDNNWFNCANWLNMQVPDETIDVTILANAQNEANIDDTQEDANIYGPIAKCKNLTIEDGADTVYVQIDDANDELQVKDVLTFEANGKLYNTGGGTLTVDGNIIINDGALLDMHNVTAAGSVLNLKGDWTDNNTVDDNTHGYYETDSKVVFVGTTQQAISDATGNETFFNVQINNSNGLDLNGNDATVSGTLDLTLGDITTGANNVIINSTSTTSITNNSTSSYINGNLRRYVGTTGSYNFPVGTLSQYELANINLNSSSGITYFDSKFTNPVGTTDITSLGLTTDGTSLVTLLDYGYWTISPDAVTLVDYDVTITSRGHSNGGSLADQHTIVKRHDSSVDWISFDPPNHNNATQSGTGTNPISAKLSHLTTFSDYAIARSQENTLPIVLYEFNAKSNNGIVEINWITKTEINNDYFIVERSINGIDFYNIYRIAGAGNSNTIISYNTIDNKPQEGYLYYRLKQVDYNGDYTYSKIVTVKISDNSINANPNNVIISNDFIKIEPNSDEKYNVEIYNLNGQLLYNNNMNEPIEINISQYSKGIYLLKIYSKNNIYSKKIIK